MFEKLSNFIKEVRLEAKKVNWPTRQETIKNTLIVVVFSLGVAMILGLFDFIFTTIIKRIVL